MRTAKVPTGLRAKAIEYRARHIADPVERLRFLRIMTIEETRTRTLARRYTRLFWLAPAIAFVLLIAAVPVHKTSTSVISPTGTRRLTASVATGAPDVWLAEQREEFDLYSNGLRIENEFAVSGERRSAFPIYTPIAGNQPVSYGTEPAGVVFHSTESDQAPFERSQAVALTRIGRSLLSYVRSNRLYHFVIDRFGRVFRIVREADKANHAGHSVWADRNRVLISLNASFLAIAFEARSEAASPLNTAQLHSARLLTEVLRSRYRLDPSHFVTHAQVSVNPSNMRIGYHTDWAAGLPFAALGLPDNYRERIGSVALFGFEYDRLFVTAMGGRPWPGLVAAGKELERAAAEAGLSPNQYRLQLHQQYKRILRAHTRATRESG